MLTVGLFAIIKNNYGLIMDADRNPLFALPPAQRFQTMVYLSAMWTAIFCGSLGAWFWYGELLIAHVLFALGALTTGLQFRAASVVRDQTAALLKASIGGTRRASDSRSGKSESINLI